MNEQTHSLPTTVTDQAINLPIESIAAKDRDMIDRLFAGGYQVQIGLTPQILQSIIAMAQEPAIKEFCPNDFGKRFANAEAAELWVTKGRAVFALLATDANGGLRLAGYGWVGRENSEAVPSGRSTFALRISQADQGKGLAAPFAWSIIAGGTLLYGLKDFWLETWGSNGGAVHNYEKIGFEAINEKLDERPTLQADVGIVYDNRIYMILPNEQLPQPAKH